LSKTSEAVVLNLKLCIAHSSGSIITWLDASRFARQDYRNSNRGGSHPAAFRGRLAKELGSFVLASQI
ncbi:hypothetical protein ACC771_04090, partial [Rhizobium ruizarguesonis]